MGGEKEQFDQSSRGADGRGPDRAHKSCLSYQPRELRWEMARSNLLFDSSFGDVFFSPFRYNEVADRLIDIRTSPGCI